MLSGRGKLYALIFTSCIAGYTWLYYIVTNADFFANKSICIFKNSTNIPCPSCGSTRAVVSIMKGDFIPALATNPLGYVIAGILFLAQIWIVIDLFIRKDSLFIVYQKVEESLKKPLIAIPLILSILINWIWNITKGL